MIPKDIKKQINKVKNLKLVNTNKQEYRFDSKTNILYIPISETDFRGMLSFLTFLETIDFCVDNEVYLVNTLCYQCTHLKDIKFSKKLNLKKVSDLSAIFCECCSLEEIDLSNILTSNHLQNINRIFLSCITLKEINFGDNFHTANVVSANEAFSYCYNLKNIIWKDYQPFSSLHYMNSAFVNCKNLIQIDFRGLDFNKLKETKNIFYNANKDLKVIVNNTFREYLL